MIRQPFGAGYFFWKRVFIGRLPRADGNPTVLRRLNGLEPLLFPYLHCLLLHMNPPALFWTFWII